MREFLLGGTVIGQPTLIRFYVLHCALLAAGPVRCRGVAHVAHPQGRRPGHRRPAAPRRRTTREPAVPKKTKTYSVLGIASGTTVQVHDPTTLNEDNSVPSTPFMTVRLLLVTLATLAICLILALVFEAPLEEAANPEVTPNPAKAPWYFLGLQEMVGYSALMGGVIIPGLVIFGLAV